MTFHLLEAVNLRSVGLIGDKGASYDPKDENTKRNRDWLVTYFFLLFIMALALLVLGILCVVSKDKIRALVLVCFLFRLDALTVLPV